MIELRSKRFFFTALLAAILAAPSSAQTFTKLVTFDGSNGEYPRFSSLVQGPDGNFYGTTSGGQGPGSVFRMTPTGTLTTIHRFCSEVHCYDGANPYGGLTLGTDGNFYGATTSGDTNGNGGGGTLFRITPAGGFARLNKFGSGGGAPLSALLQATDGNFYGTSSTGGANCDFRGGCGTVFKLTPTGALTTLYNFCVKGGCEDGSTPWGGLVQGTDGRLYGTTTLGGIGNNCLGGCGTVFAITLAGRLTTLHSFDAIDGYDPTATLVQAADGSFYGTTYSGGAYISGGTVFKVTPGGTFSNVYSFGGVPGDGNAPYAGLIQGTDGNFYGTTSGDTAFSITSGGTLTTLYKFCSQSDCSDGSLPEGALVQGTDGTFYGMTNNGGGSTECQFGLGCGTIFSISTGLGPFVSLVRNPAKVGQAFGILGQGLTGTTSVSINGMPASFSVESDTLLEAIVPDGATTGSVVVTTPGGTLNSNKNLGILPQLLSFNPPSGPVGTVVTITGVSLTQTSGVGFGDQVPASFTVNSDTQVTATVPAGAKTGPVGIETQGGTALSTRIFTVTR